MQPLSLFSWGAVSVVRPLARPAAAVTSNTSTRNKLRYSAGQHECNKQQQKHLHYCKPAATCLPHTPLLLGLCHQETTQQPMMSIEGDQSIKEVSYNSTSSSLHSLGNIQCCMSSMALLHACTVTASQQAPCMACCAMLCGCSCGNTAREKANQ